MALKQSRVVGRVGIESAPERRARRLIAVAIQIIAVFLSSAFRRNCPTAFVSRLLMNALGDLAAKIAGGCNRCDCATAV
jgi:hypothetical protein